MFLRCFLVGLPCVAGRWLRTFGREENTVYRQNLLLRCEELVVNFGSLGYQVDSLPGSLCIS